MKKLTTLLLIAVFVFPALLLAESQELKITTYYPAPHGEYENVEADSITLHAKSGSTSGWVGGAIGEIKYSSDNDALFRFNGSAWVPLGGAEQSNIPTQIGKATSGTILYSEAVAHCLAYRNEGWRLPTLEELSRFALVTDPNVVDTSDAYYNARFWTATPSQHSWPLFYFVNLQRGTIGGIHIDPSVDPDPEYTKAYAVCVK